MFTNLATLTELALAIRNGNGSLTAGQQAQIDSAPSEESSAAAAAAAVVSDQTGAGGSTLEMEAQGKGTKKEKKGGKKGKANQGKSTVIEQGNPLCPWFVCCY